ncbi:MAG: dienelactone hydrolase family protein [Chloroflexota bacterium]|nr:dienelactone hydrolase family protein [Chloroflexota bacterium]
MCFSDDARPPQPPMAGGAVDAGDVVLASPDGTRVAAYAARAARPGGPGVVVIPDVRGLQPYYEELALRFAEAGAHAVAIDQYARSAGTAKRSEGFGHEEHVASLRRDALAADVGAAAAYLRSSPGGGADRVYTIGFCLGGRVSLLQATEGYGLSGVIGLYPWPVGEHRSGLPAPADLAQQFECPVLAIYGGADRGIPREAVEAFDRALADSGIEHESIVYDGAPHSFFDRRQTEFADASTDAWQRILSFIGIRSA